MVNFIWILGLDIATASLAFIIAAIYNMYIHSDTKSPRVLGYFIQRPEMHRIHHKRNVHKDNYGLPIWDIIFGTFKNPVQNNIKCGFDNAKEMRVKDMLLGRDVFK